MSIVSVATKNHDALLSYSCMESCDFLELQANKEFEKIDSIAKLEIVLNSTFQFIRNKNELHEKILQILGRIDLNATEVNKYAFFDVEKAYTRNLLATDNKHYTLLLLCWSPGKESKIHNHPCNGCYVKTIRGCVKESKYEVVKELNSIKFTKARFFCEGQISFINENIGLHKIGNPNKDTGTITLHLYTPPFTSCKVWAQDGIGALSQSEDAKMG